MAKGSMSMSKPFLLARLHVVPPTALQSMPFNSRFHPASHGGRCEDWGNRRSTCIGQLMILWARTASGRGLHPALKPKP